MLITFQENLSMTLGNPFSKIGQSICPEFQIFILIHSRFPVILRMWGNEWGKRSVIDMLLDVFRIHRRSPSSLSSSLPALFTQIWECHQKMPLLGSQSSMYFQSVVVVFKLYIELVMCCSISTHELSRQQLMKASFLLAQLNYFCLFVLMNQLSQHEELKRLLTYFWGVRGVSITASSKTNWSLEHPGPCLQ